MVKIILDSSNKDLYVGLIKNDELIDEIRYEAWQRQSEYMVVELEKILSRNNVDRNDIDGIICGIGPGSYTGVRISLTIAKTISLALNVKLYPVSSLLLLADYQTPSIVLMNARSKRSYIGVYHLGEPLLNDTILTNDEVLEYIASHPDYAIFGEGGHLKIEAKTGLIGQNVCKLLPKLESAESSLIVKPKYLKD